MTPRFWKDRRVLVTGHTGFKGAWLSLWLAKNGAHVTGVALAPDGDKNLYTIAGLERDVRSHLFDINDRAALGRVFDDAQPEIVLHLAAQSLVRPSYVDPVGTFATNTLGVATLLDAVRQCPSVRAAVMVTSDKCYENREWVWPYRESEPMGGHDPYSASKGAAELVAQAMRRSYFSASAKNRHPARIATARAGNVIGGGDFSVDRLVPDIMRGALSGDGVVILRNPTAVRPWQHALDPLNGYLQLAEALITQPDAGFDDCWNFGPDPADDRAVGDLADDCIAALGQGRAERRPDPNAPHEAHLLRLDSAKARADLGWRPTMPLKDAVAFTAQWYRAWRAGQDMRAFTLDQLDAFESKLNDRKASS